MTDDRQKEIFGKNLSNYVSLSGKEQKDIANDLGYPATTFNTWCSGKAIPTMGKVQHIADYFNIGKSELLDDKCTNKYSIDNAVFITKMQKDRQAMRILKYFELLNAAERNTVEQLIKVISDNKIKKGE